MQFICITNRMIIWERCVHVVYMHNKQNDHLGAVCMQFICITNRMIIWERCVHVVYMHNKKNDDERGFLSLSGIVLKLTKKYRRTKTLTKYSFGLVCLGILQVLLYIHDSQYGVEVRYSTFKMSTIGGVLCMLKKHFHRFFIKSDY